MRDKLLSETESCIGGIIIADMVGFSSLQTEEIVMKFVQEFMGEVGRYTDENDVAPLARNTWGDGLYFIFRGVRATGIYALGLCDLVRDIDWAARGLPADLHIRVAVHAGPLYRFMDPVTHIMTWSGKHVVRAARMEPITPPGSVYASREFAALATAQRIPEFSTEPVGRIRLAKKEGFAPLYVLRGHE